MIVVTGASGHVGGNLIRRLIDRGLPIRATFHQDKRALEGLDVEIVRCDVQNLESLCKAFKDTEVVFHTAGYISLLMSDWSRFESINVIGTRNVVEACLACGVRRLVHFSSIHALCQEPLDLPIDENRSYVNSSDCLPYDRSKADGEREIYKGIEKGLDAVIINPTGIIGPYDFRPSHTGQVILALARGTLPILVRGGFDWVDVRDVVEGALRAEKHASSGARYILSGHWTSIRDIASAVEVISGVCSPQFVVPIWLARIGVPFTTAYSRLKKNRPLYTVFSLKALKSNPNISHAKATRELDYHPMPFKETIRDTMQWFKDKRWIEY